MNQVVSGDALHFDVLLMAYYRYIYYGYVYRSCM